MKPLKLKPLKKLKSGSGKKPSSEGLIANEIEQSDCIEAAGRFRDRQISLVLGSPPYALKFKRYGHKGIAASGKHRTQDWANWMLEVTQAWLPKVSNCVVWVANGAMQDGAYQPACELLMVKAWEAGLIVERPVVWCKNASPNRKDYFKNAWEYVMCFRPADSVRYFDLEAVGSPPLYKAGGHFRQRDVNGKRKVGNDYPQSKLARPADFIGTLPSDVDLLYITVGGGHMGSNLAHANAAPYPEKLVFPLIAALTKPGELVVDPFSGSGTTSAVAKKLKRSSFGFNRDESMVNLSKLRLEEVTQ